VGRSGDVAPAQCSTGVPPLPASPACLARSPEAIRAVPRWSAGLPPVTRWHCSLTRPSPFGQGVGFILTPASMRRGAVPGCPAGEQVLLLAAWDTLSETRGGRGGRGSVRAAPKHARPPSGCVSFLSGAPIPAPFRLPPSSFRRRSSQPRLLLVYSARCLRSSGDRAPPS
jgi:hypothetical protein